MTYAGMCEINKPRYVVLSEGYKQAVAYYGPEMKQAVTNSQYSDALGQRCQSGGW